MTLSTDYAFFSWLSANFTSASGQDSRSRAADTVAFYLDALRNQPMTSASEQIAMSFLGFVLARKRHATQVTFRQAILFELPRNC
jgi:hypothetical protein